MPVSNPDGLAPMVNDAMQPGPYLPCGGSDYSATSLLKSPRELQLSKRHRAKIDKNKKIQDTWVLFIGNAVHSALEKELERKYSAQYLIERKITRHDLGRRVVAKFDAYDVGTKTLADHKTTRIGMRRGAPELWNEFKADHMKQLMLNAYFLMEEGYDVQRFAINNIFLDWQPGVAKFAKADDYPKTPAIEISAKAPSYDECKAYYEERLKLHVDAESIEDKDLPYCTPEECWQKESCFAVVPKSGVGRSRKNAATKEEAEWFLENKVARGTRTKYHVEERPGARTKCDMFCDAAPFCNQYANYLKGEV